MTARHTHMRAHSEGRRSRRGSALLAVFAFVIAALLLSSTLLSVSRVGLRTTAASLEGSEARLLAGSAALAYLAEIEDQRSDLLLGGRPVLDESITLFELPDGRRAIARLLPIGDDLIVSENAKLDVNEASAEMLASLELIDGELAQAIVEARNQRPFTSLADLLEVEGMTPELLYGDAETLLDELSGGDPFAIAGFGMGAGAGAGGGAGGAMGEPLEAERLSDVLTVYAFDPNVMAGVSGDPDDEGKQRVNLNQPWSDDLRQPIERRYGTDIADAMERLMSSDRVSFDDVGSIVRLLSAFRVEVEDWPEVLDVFTASPDPYLPGRIDIMRARPEVLAALPGVDAGVMEAMLAERETLSEDEALTPVWLVEREVMSGGALAGLIDLVTARSTQWRVRIEVGFESEEALSGARSGDLGGLELTHRVVLEVVLDAAAPRARIAELVDITYLEAALRMGSLAREADDADPMAELLGEEYEAMLAGADTEEMLASGVGLMDVDDAGDRADLRRAERERARDAGRPARRERTAPLGGIDRGSSDSAGDGDDGEGAAGGGGANRPPPPEGVDRRLGRWTRPGGR